MSLNLKHVVCDTDRHGNTRYYVRVPGTGKVRIRHDPGTKAFMAAYNRAIGKKVAIEPISPVVDMDEEDILIPEEGKMSIYVIQAGGAVKIGITKNIRTRIQGLQIGHPHDMACCYMFEMRASKARKLESSVHRSLRPHHLRGEWFQTTPSDAAEAIERVARALRIGIREVPMANKQVPHFSKMVRWDKKAKKSQSFQRPSERV